MTATTEATRERIASAPLEGVETIHRCPVCHKKLIQTNVVLLPHEYIQCLCKWCQKERRFRAAA